MLQLRFVLKISSEKLKTNLKEEYHEHKIFSSRSPDIDHSTHLSHVDFGAGTQAYPSFGTANGRRSTPDAGVEGQKFFPRIQ